MRYKVRFKHMYCADFAETALFASFGIILYFKFPQTTHLYIASGKGAMGGAPYIGPRLWDGAIFEAQLDIKEYLGKISTQSSKFE